LLNLYKSNKIEVISELLAEELKICPPLITENLEIAVPNYFFGKWLSHLSEQEQHVLKLRFGLDANERHTLAEIGRLLEVSRERVRQVELKALRKLRNLTRKLPSGI